VLDDGTRNPFAIMRLKNKLGNRSNASAEVELDATRGWLIGDEGEGVARIVEMVNYTRMDCALGSAALVRAALVQAINHAAHRRTFGRLLIEHPLMQNVLADLALESEAATVLCMRVAHAIDEAARDSRAAALKRIGTAIAKYYVCKRAPQAVGEALECLGGNGYVEESVMPRLYREAPLNSIWEGSGNINALDVQRILRKQPESLVAWRDEIAPAMGDTRISEAASALQRDVDHFISNEARARGLSERMAVLWQASLLLQHAPSLISDAFIASRIERRAGVTFGTLPDGTNVRAIVERAAPATALVNA
jgi:putative acyl-CoA dehydrogenase